MATTCVQDPFPRDVPGEAEHLGSGYQALNRPLSLAAAYVAAKSS